MNAVGIQRLLRHAGGAADRLERRIQRGMLPSMSSADLPQCRILLLHGQAPRIRQRIDIRDHIHILRAVTSCDPVQIRFRRGREIVDVRQSQPVVCAEHHDGRILMAERIVTDGVVRRIRALARSAGVGHRHASRFQIVPQIVDRHARLRRRLIIRGSFQTEQLTGSIRVRLIGADTCCDAIAQDTHRMVLSLPDTCAEAACGSLYGILRYCCRTAGIKRTGDGIEIVVRTIHAVPAVQHLPAGPVVAHMLASDPLPAIPDGSGIGVQQVPGSVNRLFAIQHPAHAAVVEHPISAAWHGRQSRI